MLCLFEQTITYIGHGIGRCGRDLRDQEVQKGLGGQGTPLLINFKNIYSSLDIKRVDVVED
jgi:hypothetical protein